MAQHATRHSVQHGRVCNTARCATRQCAGCAAACTRLRGRAPQAMLARASLGHETKVRLPVAPLLWRWKSIKSAQVVALG